MCISFTHIACLREGEKESERERGKREREEREREREREKERKRERTKKKRFEWGLLLSIEVFAPAKILSIHDLV